ncbi:HlyC/CorC family transporter [Proteiniclasticum sp. BAD-10]|uniref:HlyC/CorC family transporter n=1 Tax=Proteiniclasticum sediminis TaxID=2804028 RepID=A0A941CLM6_9CLOT|nr:hemolysin family protein [Proteiniclasticum sediminis]MBR0574921.1 HlyC/CorC family transporter [Proteiniclasticum sediminis]
MDASGLGTQLLFIVVLIFVNAFFSMSEMAMVSANKVRITMLKDKGNKKAEKLLRILERPSNFLSTIQVGITLAGFLASAQAATGLSQYLTAFMAKLRIPFTEQASIIVITILLSYFTLVFGELVPKRIALQNSEKVAMGTVGIIDFISKVFRPFVLFLSFSTNIFARLVGIHSDTLEEEVSLEEIRSIIEVGKEKGVINETERDMLDGIFEFDNKLAREIMTPRTEVEMIELSEPANNIVAKVTNGNFSRIPIYVDEVDNVVGILYIKDLFRQLINKGKVGNIEDLLRKPYFAPENKYIDDLFKEMQLANAQMAILLDEYGGFSGIVTIEDILEEIVGNIYDEHDVMDEYINKVTDNIYLIDALVSIDDVNDALGLEIESDNADSIGGYVIERLDRVPKKGDSVYFEGHEFKVQQMSGRRIKILKLIMNPEKHDAEYVENDR